MGEHKHTEGPWEAVAGTTTGMLVIAPNEPKVRRNVAAVGGPRREDRARLIAAAPDLLEVVKSFVAETVEYMTINNLGDPEIQHNVKWARQVIAKAEGSGQ